jgi:hypothetical protein
MQVYERFGSHRLDIPISARRGNHAIPLRKETLDHPESFVTYSLESHLILNRLGHYYIVIGREGIQTQHVFSTEDNQLFLISEFGELSRASILQKIDGLAVCGFNIVPFYDSQKSEWAENRLAVDIMQFQTDFKDDKDGMYNYVGFIQYHELFTHMVEQLAIFLERMGLLPIEYITIQKAMKYDWQMALSHTAVVDTSTVPITKKYDRVKAKEEREQILARRRKFASNQKYTKTLTVAGKMETSDHESFAKDIHAVTVDAMLQAYFDTLFSKPETDASIENQHLLRKVFQRITRKFVHR